MIIPDINLLLYATITGLSQHERARPWLEKALTDDQIGLIDPVLFGFLRIATNPRIFEDPMSITVALAHAESWLERDNVRLLPPGQDFHRIVFDLLRTLGTAANLTTDVQIAAATIEYQGELCSNDTDFGKFPGLRWSNPLI